MTVISQSIVIRWDYTMLTSGGFMSRVTVTPQVLYDSGFSTDPRQFSMSQADVTSAISALSGAARTVATSVDFPADRGQAFVSLSAKYTRRLTPVSFPDGTRDADPIVVAEVVRGSAERDFLSATSLDSPLPSWLPIQIKADIANSAFVELQAAIEAAVVVT